MGMFLGLDCQLHIDSWVSFSLLSSPFDYSQAFDRALKEVVKTLPSRPAKETSDEAVRIIAHISSIRRLILG
jgi:hypothetical protein